MKTNHDESSFFRMLALLSVLAALIFFAIHFHFEIGSGLFLNLGVEFIGIFVVVFCIDVIIRRRLQKQWVPVDYHIQDRIFVLSNKVVGSVRTKLRFRQFSLDDIKAFVTEGIDISPRFSNDRSIEFLRRDILPNLDEKMSNVGHEDLSEFNESMGEFPTAIAEHYKLFHHRMNPVQVKLMLELEDTLNNLLISLRLLLSACEKTGPEGARLSNFLKKSAASKLSVFLEKLISVAESFKDNPNKDEGGNE